MFLRAFFKKKFRYWSSEYLSGFPHLKFSNNDVPVFKLLFMYCYQIYQRLGVCYRKVLIREKRLFHFEYTNVRRLLKSGVYLGSRNPFFLLSILIFSNLFSRFKRSSKEQKKGKYPASQDFWPGKSREDGNSYYFVNIIE